MATVEGAAEQQRASQRAMRDVVVCLEKEGAKAKKLLQQAAMDCVSLGEENVKLKTQLAEALAWEPDA